MFYDNFIKLCKGKGVTPSAVMRAIGLNKSSASYWKKGTTPSSDTLQKVADYFGVSVDYLLDINPLPLKEVQLDTGRRVTLESYHQEFLATFEYLEEMGYKIAFKFGPDNPNNKWTLCDVRSGKEYLVSGDRLNKLRDGIAYFAKFQIKEMISELTEMPRYRRQEPAGAPPAPAGDTDTPAAQDAPEGAEEAE